MSHPAVELDYILGRKVEIDEAIAPLVQFLWQLDIRTASSCQGDPGGEWAHLILPTQDLIRLLNIMSSLAPDDDGDDGDELGFSKLYHRMAPWELATHNHPGLWRYDTSFYREQPGDCIRADTMVEFPHEDIPTLESILRRAVQFNKGEDA
jgi:hypothetical protein